MLSSCSGWGGHGKPDAWGNIVSLAWARVALVWGLKVEVDARRYDGCPVHGLLGTNVASRSVRCGAGKVVGPVDARCGVGLGDEVVRGVPSLSLRNASVNECVRVRYARVPGRKTRGLARLLVESAHLCCMQHSGS